MLLPRKQPSIKQGKRFGAHEHKSNGIVAHFIDDSLSNGK
jgi:hypothetical protein